MRSALLQNIRQLVYVDRDVPVCPPDGLRLRVKACGVCATDVKIYHYGHRLLQLPRVLGHELAGVIDAVGPQWAAQYQPGQRVAVCAVIACGQCRSAQRQPACPARAISLKASPSSRAVPRASSARRACGEYSGNGLCSGPWVDMLIGRF